jgi:acyl carrier protein
MKRTELENEIKALIVGAVEVDGLTVESIGSEDSLFGDGVGLDSIDALEIGAAIKKKYQVKFRTNADENREHFRSVSSLASFVAENAGINLE